MSLTIEEGKAMVKAARKYDRVFQTGSQQRSDARYRLACELVRNGRIGKVHTVEARIGDNPIGGPFPEVAVPKGLDWDFWKGPTADVPYVKERCHYEFRWWYEYCGGKMTDWGAHHNDIAQWGLGMDGSGPICVTASGVTPSKKPNSLQLPSPLRRDLRIRQRRPADHDQRRRERQPVHRRSGLDLREPRADRGQRAQAASRSRCPGTPIRLYVSNDHMGNFMDCIRQPQAVICDVEVGHRSVSVCHMGAIALRLGIPLNWDPVAQHFVGPRAEKGNAMLSREMRSPWQLEV